ncbi:MAG: triose-phosphate isomerase [Gemmatimonadaceae bacterium]|nr:triose-phosphate isomerase [Gemmatimonadaceae bacterium]
MKLPIFAANWKMNHGPTDARAFVKSFLAHYPRQQDRKVVFFPNALSVTTVAEAVRDRPDLAVGVQNIHFEDKGAFTGENSAPMARDAGATHVLVGHSERRHVFGESDAAAGQKVQAALRAGLTPVLCVGELLAEREAGETEAVVLRQLRAGVAGLEAPQVAGMLFAYEPVWAIGTGRTATPADANAVHVAIRAALREAIGERAMGVPILYGGSVSRSNAPLLLAEEEIDGVLVGGASLDADGWNAIVRA